MPLRVLSRAFMAVCLCAFIHVCRRIFCACACSVEDVHPLPVWRFIQFILVCMNVPTYAVAETNEFMCGDFAALAAECKD